MQNEPKKLIEVGYQGEKSFKIKGVIIKMNDSKLDSPSAIKTFLAGADKIEFAVFKERRYEWIAGRLKLTGYFLLQKEVGACYQ